MGESVFILESPVTSRSHRKLQWDLERGKKQEQAQDYEGISHLLSNSSEAIEVIIKGERKPLKLAQILSPLYLF